MADLRYPIGEFAYPGLGYLLSGSSLPDVSAHPNELLARLQFSRLRRVARRNTFREVVHPQLFCQ